MLRLWTSTSLCAAIACATSPALAQTVAEAPTSAQDAAQGTPDAPDAAASASGDIIVTAQRRSERLQDVPVTVTVFGAEEIRNARIQEFADVAQRTPGLTFDAFPAGQPRPFIRGIGSVDRGAAGDPSSAVFVDEIYLGRPAAIAFDAFDVQQIEVLKGPQGTLFGRNVVGGAVNVTTRRPDPGKFDASVEATYGNYDRTEVAGFINVPVANGTGALRASGSVRKHDGYARNRFTGGDADDQDTVSGRLQLLAEPNDVTRFQLSADYTRDRASSPAQYVFDREPGSPRAVLWTVNRDRDAYASEFDGRQDRDTWGVRGQVDLSLGFSNLIYIGSYRELDYSLLGDFDGGNPTFNRAGISGGNTEETEFWSNELRLVSPDDSPIKWVAGVYAFNQRVVRDDSVSIYARASLTAPVPTALPTDIYDQRASLDSIAVFADVTVPLGDRIRVFGGLRYSKDDKDFSISNARSTALFRATGRFTVTADESFDAFTWRAGADFRVAEDNLLYGLVSRGFKSGGFQDTPSSAASAVTPFQPEFATQYEVGLKSQFFDRRVTWNNTLFYTDYTDLQTRQVSGLSIITNNAGKATIKGYETALSLRPTDRIGLAVSYAYTDAKFDEYVEVGVDLAGNRLSRAPKHKLVVSPGYTFPIGNGGELLFAADYQYTSKIFDDNTNGPIEVQKPVELIDARIVFTLPGGKYQLSAWGKNLTNELYRTFQAQFFGANFGAYAPPRTYGATLRVNY